MPKMLSHDHHQGLPATTAIYAIYCTAARDDPCTNERGYGQMPIRSIPSHQSHQITRYPVTSFRSHALMLLFSRRGRCRHRETATSCVLYDVRPPHLNRCPHLCIYFCVGWLFSSRFRRSVIGRSCSWSCDDHLLVLVLVGVVLFFLFFFRLGMLL